MKSRRRHFQFLWWFWWSSRMIMFKMSTKEFRLPSYSFPSCSLRVVALFIGSLLLLSASEEDSCSLFGTMGVVSATELGSMSPRVVFTKQGPVQGFLGPGNVGVHYQPQTDGSYAFRHFSGRPVVEIFKGIPYASAPVGNLRYESPTSPPLRSRTQIYNANVSKPACPSSYSQILNRTSVPGDPIRALKKTMELEVDDCLYLDAYLPLNSNKNRGTGLPVLVYANSQMDDPQNPFDGSSMAAIGNIIVIMFRYRVGVLGFVRPGYTDDIRSNFGLWDQLAALQWIKENVEEFGGDQHNITYMAYDLDATLAGLLSLSPVSQAYNGLFHRLILLNGSPFSPHSINYEPRKTTFHLARNLKCPPDERSENLVSCFRRKLVSQLFGSADMIGAPLLTYPFAPIADGTLVPVDVSRDDMKQSQGVLDMLGKYDLLCGLKEGAVLPRTGRPILRDIDLSSFVTAAIKLTMKLESDVEPTDQLKREVMKAITDVYGTTPSMREVVSDFLLVHPVKELLNAHSTTQKNTFFYVFKDFDPLRLNQQNEISYIFSSKVYFWKYHSAVPDYRHLVNDARTEELKPGYGMGSPRHDLYPFVLLIDLLANFVRSGDPNVVDPNERFPNTVKPKPWPKYDSRSGRYLELGKEVEFPSGYHKLTNDLWGRTFPGLLKTFGNQTPTSDSTGFDRFPPYFPPRKDAIDENANHRDFRDSSRYPDSTYPQSENEMDGVELGGGEHEDSRESVLSGIGQNTVVLIGALLLLLNFLCFIGLFYQRERLKKTEIQLRRRFLDSRQQNPETSQEMDTASASFERAIPIPIQDGNHVPRGATPGRDAMSETETENGFGPDFLGPNYDPRTKVNRWMNMQNAHRAMLSKDNSFENPSPSFNEFHMMSRREGDMPQDGSISVLPLPPPLQPSNASHSLPHPSHYHQQHLHQHHPHQYHHPPLHIQVTSLQRNSHLPKMMPSMLEQQHTHPPPPIQILPPLPYQEPYQPSASVVGDIPYADSRATSPLPIAAPAGYSGSPPIFHPIYNNPNQDSLKRAGNTGHTPPPLQPSPVPGPSTNLTPKDAQDSERKNQHSSISNPFQGVSPTPQPPSPVPTPQAAGTPSSASSSSQPSPSIQGQDKNAGSKRTSVVIVRDLDPIDAELERCEPKLVPVKTGTLKRSVGVDTGHDGSPAKKESSVENNNKRSSSQIRVTFSEKV